MINAYCVDPLTILPHIGYDAYNQPIPDSSSASGEGIAVRGYIEWRRQLVRNQKGEEVTSTVMVMLPVSIERLLGRPLTHEDRILLRGETFDRAIIAIREPKAFSRPHYEIFLA